MSANVKKMLKIGKYEVPENVYKDGGIPAEVVNNMIELVIAKDNAVISAVIDYQMFIDFIYPQDSQQMKDIIVFLATIQCDLCDKKVKCPKCDK